MVCSVISCEFVSIKVWERWRIGKKGKGLCTWNDTHHTRAFLIDEHCVEHWFDACHLGVNVVVIFCKIVSIRVWERIPMVWRVHVRCDHSHRGQRWHWWKCCWSLFVVKRFVRNLAQTYPPVTLRVYPYPCSWVRVYVGSAVLYPDPYPPNPYPPTPGVSKTPAQHQPNDDPCMHLIRYWRCHESCLRYSKFPMRSDLDLMCDNLAGSVTNIQNQIYFSKLCCADSTAKHCKYAIARSWTSRARLPELWQRWQHRWESEGRTLVYALGCLILMRTEMGPKMVSPSILMCTESPNFGWRFNPFCIHKWPVSTEVQSHFCTFVAVDLKSKYFTLHLTAKPCLSLSAMHHIIILKDDNPFGITWLSISH